MTKQFKIVLFILLFLMLVAFNAHRFYTAIFQVNYVPQKKMIQITSRIFVDDFNDALKNQFHKATFLGTDKETDEDLILMKKYLAEKFKLTVNGKIQPMNYVNKELEDNVIICYFKINDISKLNSLSIENAVITEIHSEQQNIIQFSDNGKKSSLLLSSENTKGVLK